MTKFILKSLQVVLIENDIDARPFSAQVLACLPPLPWSVSSQDLTNSIRQDLRHLRVCSVDPPGMLLKFYGVFCLSCNSTTYVVVVCLPCNCSCHI